MKEDLIDYIIQLVQECKELEGNAEQFKDHELALERTLQIISNLERIVEGNYDKS